MPARRSARTVSSTAGRDSAQPYARANRNHSPDASRSTASIARPANGKTSLRLTVKAPPSKLRQATSGSQASSLPSNTYADTPSESDATPAPAPRAARATRNPRTVVEPDSEDDFDEPDAPGDEEELDEEDAEADLDEEMADPEDSEEDAEAEDDDMEDHPPPPVIRHTGSGAGKGNVKVSVPSEGLLKSVEDKEMEDDDDDELSELESDGGEGEGAEDDDDGDGISDDDEDEDNSRSGTPDINKLTKRQRAVLEEDPSLLALSNEALKKKHLTAEEHAMRRAEMARRRKNLSEKRNEEEKMDTINKLLSKPAPKRRTRAEMEAARAAEAELDGEDGDGERPPALYLRWVNSREGSRIGVTEEWLDAPIGEPFRKPNMGGAMVQEVA